MFRKFDIFRILICGGDGSVGWVLAEMDKLHLSTKVSTSNCSTVYNFGFFGKEIVILCHKIARKNGHIIKRFSWFTDKLIFLAPLTLIRETENKTLNFEILHFPLEFLVKKLLFHLMRERSHYIALVCKM